MPYTIADLSKKFSLSRSTLLYYDEIGLLSPRGRSKANYRLYSSKDMALMEEIAQLRRAGISLGHIKKIVGAKRSKRNDALRKRLSSINEEINLLRNQQRLILRLLGDPDMIGSARFLTKERWVSFLRKAGLNDAGLERWHVAFEISSPEAHQDFLESLGIPAEEIRGIREKCQKAGKR